LEFKTFRNIEIRIMYKKGLKSLLSLVPLGWEVLQEELRVKKLDDQLNHLAF